MPRPPSLFFVTFVALASLGGCGDAVVGGGTDPGDSGPNPLSPVDLVGFYQVTAHAFNPSDCSPPDSPVTDGEPLFEVYQPLTGSLLFVRSCTTRTSCSSGGSAFYAVGPLARAASGAYSGSAYASFATSPCQLINLRGELTGGPRDVHVEIQRRVLSDAVTGEACSPTAAETRSAEMSCVNVRALDGVKLL